MDLAGGSKRLAERDAVADAQTIDEDGHVLAQVALLIEYIAAQWRADCERVFQRRPQRASRGVDFRHGNETAQLLREDEFCHRPEIIARLHRPDVNCAMLFERSPEGDIRRFLAQ